MSDSADLLYFQLDAAGLPLPEREYRFCERRWRFDMCWPERKLAVEVEGGVYSDGRHVRGKGYTADLEKYNAAALGGWRLLRYTSQQIGNGTAWTELERVLNEQTETS